MKNKKSREIGDALEKERRLIAEAVVDKMYAAHPEFWRRYGREGIDISLRDADYHLTYLLEAINQENPSIFVQYILWLKELFSGLHFPEFVIPVILDSCRDAIHELLPGQKAAAIDPYFESAREFLEHASSPPSSYLERNAPLHSLSCNYLDALLIGDRNEARRLILEAVDSGVDIKSIYLNVFQCAQYEIGRLWYTNKISVAQEHFASAATQLIMSQLYVHVFNSKKTGKNLVAACIEGELHEIGIRMVADFFEMEGWDTFFFGSNTPIKGILKAANDFEADILALSVTMPFNQKKLMDTVQAVRTSISRKDLKIMIGGYAANSYPDLWKRAGADGHARNAEDALILAEKFLA